jgi:DNA (cytosine-5)-methyltransferase 1
VARWIGDRLVRPGSHRPDRDADLSGAARWPAAARFDGRRRWAVTISARPVHVDRLPLDAFLHHPGKPLSLRATEGFLARLRRTRLRLPAGLLDRIGAHRDLMAKQPPAPRRRAPARRTATAD